MHPDVHYYRRNGRQTVWLTDQRIVFDLERSRRTAAPPKVAFDPATAQTTDEREESDERLVFSQIFAAAKRSGSMVARSPQPGNFNFYYGPDQTQWRTNVRAYDEVVYRDVWDNIDVRILTRGQHLEQEFIVRAGGDPTQIRVEYVGIQGLQVADDGSLVIKTSFGDLRESSPQIYQQISDQTKNVVGRFKLVGDFAYSFDVESYDPAHALVIDPTLIYSTYLGGAKLDEASSIAVDSEGNALVTGGTQSTDFPIENAFQDALVQTTDVFVAKLDPTGRNLVYSTYLGGPALDIGFGVAVDSKGNAYVTGVTGQGFPTTTGAFDRTYEQTPSSSGFFALADAFAAKLAPTGDLVYSTYIGGHTGLPPDEAVASGVEPGGTDVGRAIAVDSAGSAYITGETTSKDFPTTPGAFDRRFAGGRMNVDAFVVKLDPSASSLVYSTYLGGGDLEPRGSWSFFEGGRAIGVDPLGNAYVAGTTTASDFPTTDGAFDRVYDAFSQAQVFVAKVNSTGSRLVFSTFLGRSGTHEPAGIAVDNLGNAHVVGTTDGAFPVTTGAFQRLRVGSDAFVAKLSSDGTRLLYGTYLGGNGSDWAQDVAFDEAGNAYVVGGTTATDFPTTGDAISRSSAGNADVFVSVLGAAGSSLLYSTYVGGTGLDQGSVPAFYYSAGQRVALPLAPDIALDPSGTIYVTGPTFSPDFPTTPFAFQPLTGGFGTSEAFVARLTGLHEQLRIISILPDSGGNTGSVTVEITGGSFQTGATVALERSGESEIVADPVLVGAGGDSIKATFNLRGRTPRPWDVVVSNPDGTSITLADGFVIKAGRTAAVKGTIVGRSGVEARAAGGRVKTQIFVSLENQSNVDVLIPFSFRASKAPGVIDFRPLFSIAETFTSRHGPIGNFPAKKIDNHSIAFNVVASVGAGRTTTAGFEATYECQGSEPNTSLLELGVGPSVSTETLVSCVVAELDLASRIGLIPGCLGSIASFIFSIPTYSSIGVVLLAAAETALTCSKDAINTSFVLVLEFAIGVFRLVENLAKCGVGMKNAGPPFSQTYRCVTASDPNDKVGNQGIGGPRFIAQAEPLAYAIYFENLSTATAPAQDVVVTDLLDPTTLDLSTLELRFLAFGKHAVEDNLLGQNKSVVVDLRPERNLAVQADAELDSVTGLLTVRLTSIDPDTGTPLDNSSPEGFLPPNINPSEGQGVILLTVRPQADLPTGTEVSNQASIVFDSNTPIDTQIWSNAIDADAPASAVQSLAARQPSKNFTVEWSGDDTGSGLLDFNVFVSENGSDFRPWLENTPETEALFAGEEGTDYAFYSVARDRVGNTEVPPVEPDAATTVMTPLLCDVEPDDDVDLDDINAILAARGVTAEPDDPRDADGDGGITVLDSRKCVLQCTRPRCGR